LIFSIKYLWNKRYNSW